MRSRRRRPHAGDDARPEGAGCAGRLRDPAEGRVERAVWFGMVLKQAKHPNAAQLLADFMVTTEGQALVHRPLRLGAQGRPGTFSVPFRDAEALGPDAREDRGVPGPLEGPVPSAVADVARAPPPPSPQRGTFYDPQKVGGEPIDNLDLEIEPGEFLVLLGPSGCGKTTTLRCIAGLETADAGASRSAGDRLRRGAGVNVPPNKRNIGMVFQSYALWPHMTVRKNIGYPLRARRIKGPRRTSGSRRSRGSSTRRSCSTATPPS